MPPPHPTLTKTLLLFEVGDADLCENVELFPSLEDRQVASIVTRLACDFNYTLSPQFSKLGEGKSVAYVDALKRKFSNPVARSAKLEEFLNSLEVLEDSDDVLALLPKEKHNEIERIRKLLR